MKYNINIKLHILLASLFLIFNLSCEDDDYPSPNPDALVDSTYELSLAYSVTGGDGQTNYADDNLIDNGEITVTLLEVFSDNSVVPKENATISFTLVNDDDIPDASGAGLVGFVESNKVTTDAFGKAVVTWNDGDYVGLVEVDCMYIDSNNEEWNPIDMLSFSINSIYEKVKNLQAVNNIEFELPLTLDEQVFQARVTDETGNNGVQGIDVEVEFSASEYSYLQLPNGTSAQTDAQGFANFIIKLIDNEDLDIATNENGSSFSINMNALIENSNLNCDTCTDGILSDQFTTQINQTTTPTVDVSQIDLIVVGSSSLVLSDGNSDSSNENDDIGDDNNEADNSEGNANATDEDNNSFTLNALVSDSNGVGISNISVIFEMPNGLGQLLGEVSTDNTGLAQNTLQNISSSTPDVLQSFEVIAKVIDPNDPFTTLASSSITLQVGSQLAYSFPNFNLVTMDINPSSLILNDIPADTSTDTNDTEGEDAGDDEGADDTTTQTDNITILASLRDSDGGPLSGIPVHFTNSTSIGTFSANDVASAQDGTSTVELQNITIDSSPGFETIQISANVINPEDNTIYQFAQQDLTVAYQSVLNINSVFNLTTARIQSLTSENNISIQYADTIKAWVNNDNGDGVENVPVRFSVQPDGENDIIGLISSDEVWTDQDGYANVVFSLTDANLIDFANQSINANVQVSVGEFSENEQWTYFIEGSPNIEDDVHEFNYYSSALPGSIHEVSMMTGDTLLLPFIAKDINGIRIEGVPVRYEIFGSSSPARSYGDLSEALSYTCCDNTNSSSDGTDIDIVDSQYQDIDGNGVATEDENEGIAITNYTNIINEAVTVDSIRAYITDPLTNQILFSEEVYVSVHPPSSQVASLFSYPIPETIFMDTMDSVYCDTITTIASDIQGQSLAGVDISYSLSADDQIYGYISQYLTVTDTIPNTGFYGARTTFCTYPNISLADASHTIDVDITALNTGLTDDVQIFLIENLPECPDCEASLGLISEYYELPAGDNDIFTTLVTATVIDSTENPVPANTLVQFQSLTENEDGDFVSIGSIEPYKFTNDQGIATATFNMETDVGLAQIIATAPTFNLADTMYINLTSTDATSMELVQPFPNEIMVQGGGGVEASELTMLIKDGSGNLVTEPFLVHFEILSSAPLGVYLNEHDDNDFIECATSSNGEATVTLNSGSQPGSVPIRAELYPLNIDIDCNSINSSTFTNEGIASLESVPVTVVTGPPEFGQINYSYVDISPIGGGLYEVPLSVNLWDFYSNPVADSTNVYIWIEGIATPWSVDSTYTFGDTVKWGGLDPSDNVIEVDSLLYVWNSELFDDDGLSNPTPGDGFELTGTPLWLPVPHPGAITGEAKTGMEAPDGNSYAGVAWSTVNYGTSNMFDNTVIKALTYDSDGEKLIIDGRDSHNGQGLLLPFQPGLLSIAASVQFWNYSVFGDQGLNDLDDTVAVDIQSNLTDFYQYPVDNGTILINAPGANIWSVCDPADTDNDGFIGCCDSFDVIGGQGTGDGDGVCDVISDFNTCSECVANGGAWIPDSAQDDPNVFGTQINGPNDAADDPAFGKTNGDGQVLWSISYSEALNPGDAQNPETYEDFTSTVTTQLLDPIQTSSDGVDILLIKSEVNENP